MNYCKYCGLGYITKECTECATQMDICGCNYAQAICDDCDLEHLDEHELRDLVKEQRKELRSSKNYAMTLKAEYTVKKH